jgi:predicted dehydrogenase
VPDWGRDFYGDVERCGGPLFDVHVHDADFVRWAFGPPIAVLSEGDEDRVVTRYIYADGPDEVVAEGAWLREPGAAFHMGFRVEFEGGVLDYAYGRDPVLALERKGHIEAVGLEASTGYDGEIVAVLAAVGRRPQVAGHPDPQALMAEAVPLTAMLEAECASLETGGRVEL